jgi:hypothetical protein
MEFRPPRVLDPIGADIVPTNGERITVTLIHLATTSHRFSSFTGTIPKWMDRTFSKGVMNIKIAPSYPLKIGPSRILATSIFVFSSIRWNSRRATIHSSTMDHDTTVLNWNIVVVHLSCIDWYCSRYNWRLRRQSMGVQKQSNHNSVDHTEIIHHQSYRSVRSAILWPVVNWLTTVPNRMDGWIPVAARAIIDHHFSPRTDTLTCISRSGRQYDGFCHPWDFDDRYRTWCCANGWREWNMYNRWYSISNLYCWSTKRHQESLNERLHNSSCTTRYDRYTQPTSRSVQREVTTHKQDSQAILGVHVHTIHASRWRPGTETARTIRLFGYCFPHRSP